MRTRAKRNRITLFIDDQPIRLDHLQSMPADATHIIKRDANANADRRDYTYEFFNSTGPSPNVPLEVWSSAKFEHEVANLPHDSIVTWPDSVSTGRTPSVSIDQHRTLAHAKAVCDGIARDGLGGERQIFPLKTEVRLSMGLVPNSMVCTVESLRQKANSLRLTEPERIRNVVKETTDAANAASEAMDALHRGSQWIPVEPWYGLVPGQLYWIQRTQYEGEDVPDSRVGAPVLCRWTGSSGWSGYMPPGTSLLVWD